MTLEDAIEKYKQKFNFFPYFLLMGAPEESIVDAITKALESGEPIRPKSGRVI